MNHCSAGSSSRSQYGPILGVETSCDETAAAVVDPDRKVLANIVCSQHDLHDRYGGVVPELASRRHVERIEVTVDEALRTAQLRWSDLKAVAVTRGPGLAGALLVGVSYAKAVAYALKLPLVGVSHLEAHIASAWIEEPDFPIPCVVLVVSGGHTHLYLAGSDGFYRLLGQTLDDAAGEAFDKAAHMLGLGYPGGPAIDRLAKMGNPDAIRFPRPHFKKGNLDFSFSGLKTALLYRLRDLLEAGIEPRRADLAASFQEAIVDVLVAKAFEAVRRHRVKALAVVGGVSANSRLRALLASRAAEVGIRLGLPSLAYCTDNAAMVAVAGLHALEQGRRSTWELESDVESPLAAIAADSLSDTNRP
jgi:N6-L-threonylcarbamoyladenine synthase